MVRVVFILFLHNEKGYSLIQTIISFTIVVLLVTTIVPSIIHIKIEQSVLKQQLSSSYKLHDLLVKEINSKSTINKTGKINAINYKIVYRDKVIEICGNWINVKDKEENRCYYGKKQEL